MIGDPLEQLLRECVVRIVGDASRGGGVGSGFFVAPGRILTCAHVVGDSAEVQVVWENSASTLHCVGSVTARHVDGGRPIEALEADYPDVAEVAVEWQQHPCVAIDVGWPATGTALLSAGYPPEGGSFNKSPAALVCRGIYGNEPSLFIDLQADVVRGGMSGAPLLDRARKRVCGIVTAGRNPDYPTGGLAIAFASLVGRLEDVLTANTSHVVADGRWLLAAGQRDGRIRFRLPRVVSHFTGRDEQLAHLHEQLTARGRVAVTQIINGLGGIGKTQLAAEYVRRHCDEYEIVAWIRAETQANEALAALATELGVPRTVPVAERADEAIRELERTERSWLLVLDNIDSPGQLESICPNSRNGRVIVTTRRRDLHSMGEPFPIDVLGSVAAVDYLIGRAPNAGDRADASRVAQALGCLPLALAHAGAYCAEGATFEDYLHLLGELPAQEMFLRNRAEFYERAIAATWEPSIAAAKQHAPAAEQILGIASYLAAEDIPASIFKPSSEDPKSRASQLMAIHDGIAALERYSLIARDGDRFSVHRLLQKIIRDTQSDDEAHAIALSALNNLVAELPASANDPASWPMYRALAPHVLTVTQYLGDHHDGLAVGAFALDKVGVYLRTAGDYKHAVEVHEDALEFGRFLEQGRREDLWLQLAHSYWSAARPLDAIPIEEKIANERTARLGTDHPESLVVRQNLAMSYRDIGDFAKAATILEECVAAYEKVFGRDSPLTLTARNNLALAYLDTGRGAEAMPIFKEVVEDRARVHGADNVLTWASRYNLAVAYSSSGDLNDAVELYEQVIAARRRILGADHPETLAALTNLASTLAKSGRDAEALVLAKEAASGMERVLGADHTNTLLAEQFLADALHGVGDDAAATELRERLAAKYERLFGATSWESLAARLSLATAYRAAGRREDAARVYDQAASDLDPTLGADNPALQAMRTLSTMILSGADDEALEAFESALEHADLGDSSGPAAESSASTPATDAATRTDRPPKFITGQ